MTITIKIDIGTDKYSIHSLATTELSLDTDQINTDTLRYIASGLAESALQRAQATLDRQASTPPSEK